MPKSNNDRLGNEELENKHGLQKKPASFKKNLAEAQQIEFVGLLQRDPSLTLEKIKDPLFLKLLKWKALQRLRGDGNTSEHPEKDPKNLNLVQEFDYACERYLLTGEVPKGLSETLMIEWKGGKGRFAANRLDWAVGGDPTPLLLEYCQDLETLRERLKELQKKATPAFDYKPQVGFSDEEPVNPEDIEAKVTPFYGGYYRKQVCRFDPVLRKIVQDAAAAAPFELSEQGQVFLDSAELKSSNNPDGTEQKKYHYEISVKGELPVALELPYKAVPLVETLEPKNLQFLRGEDGVFYLADKQCAALGALQHGGEAQQVHFDFVLEDLPELRLKDAPEGEPEPFWGSLDEASEVFLSNIQADRGLSQRLRMEKTRDFVRKKFKYPADAGERDAMNSACENSPDPFAALCAGGIADCHWANLFAGELMKRQGVHHRLIAGRYVEKDPRFEFAALAGTGHAWGEVWVNEEWQRMDATPAKEKPEKKEPPEDEKPEEPQEPLDGDFGEAEAPEEQEELSVEDLQKRYEAMAQKAGEMSPHTPEILFEEKEGVSLEKWKVVEAFIKAVNKTPVSADMSINGRASDLEGQYRLLFDLLYKRRKVPSPSFRGSVRESESPNGGIHDIAELAVHVLAGDPDPMGFEVPSVQLKEHVDILAFEDDAIMDLTFSMQGSPAEEQKKMILTGLYNLMNLNARFHLDGNRKTMCHPLTLKSHLQVFKGNTTVEVVHDPSKPLDKKALVALFSELDQTAVGAGNLLGALLKYEASLKSTALQKIKKRELLKVLTVVSDGEVAKQPECVAAIARLRAQGILVQGIGFGSQAKSIEVVCHDEKDPLAAKKIDDVREATLTRHAMLAKHLKKL